MKPNVVIIVVDALRADRAVSEDKRTITPKINELTTESVCFPNSFTVINSTDPAVTSLHTGRYPLSHGLMNHGMRVTDKEKAIIENVPQLPELLSEAGYRTAAFGRPRGRWHKRGFDEHPEYDIRNEPIKNWIGSVLHRIHPSIRDIAATVHDLTVGRLESKAKTEGGVAQDFRNFLDGSAPFYAFIHLMDTHIPYEPDPDLVKEYLNRFEYSTQSFNDWTDPASAGIFSQEFRRRIKDGKYPEIAKKYYYTDGEPTSAVVDAHYDATVHEADQRVGRILDALKERDQLDETVFIVLADHGESLTEHGIYYDHHGLYDESVKIPLIIRPPGGTPDRETVDDFIQITDIAPTVASYADVDGLNPDGKSLKPVIEGEGEVEREFVMAEETHTQRRRMIRTEEEKLIYLVGGDTVCRYCDVQHAPETELYNIADDPEEKNNLRTSRQERVSELREKAEKMAESYKDRSVEVRPDEKVKYEDEEEVQKRLEHLGYK